MIRKLIVAINFHPAVIAITQDPLSRWVCRVIGHRWDWPDIVITETPEGFRFLPSWRGCERCGHREQDEREIATVHVVPQFQGPVEGLNPKPKDELGERVKREMGWI